MLCVQFPVSPTYAKLEPTALATGEPVGIYCDPATRYLTVFKAPEAFKAVENFALEPYGQLSLRVQLTGSREEFKQKVFEALSVMLFARPNREEGWSLIVH